MFKFKSYDHIKILGSKVGHNSISHEIYRKKIHVVKLITFWFVFVFDFLISLFVVIVVVVVVVVVVVFGYAMDEEETW